MAEIKKKTLRLTTLAVLGALAIVLSALENLIPPLPMMPGPSLGFPILSPCLPPAPLA